MIQIDEAARHLGTMGLRLYLRLLALGVQMRSNSIEVSDRWLYGDLGISKDGLTVAKRQIVRYVTVEIEDGVVTRYGLPLPWLNAQSPMFPYQGALLNRADRPAQQGTSVLPNRAPLPFSAGQTALPNRAECPAQQGDCPAEQGGVPRSTGRSALPDRAPATENQQLAADPLIRSDQDLILERSDAVNQISQIASVEKLRPEQKEVASLLSSLLVDYMQRHHPPGECEWRPAERIVARCLAIADLETLRKTLTTLHNEGRTSGKKFAWFVTVFLNRIHGIKAEVVVETFEQVLQEKKLRTKPDDLFADDLVTQTQSKLRRLG
jgi:hypothetical protein